MTRLTKRIALTLGAGLVVLGALTAGGHVLAQNTNPDQRPFSGGRGRGGPMGPGGRMGLGPDGPLGMLRMLGPRLGLTDAQKDQLKAIAESHREEWKGLADRARTAHEALRAAIMADTVDDVTIRAKSAEAAAVEADLAVAAAHARAEAWQVLTPEQQAKAKQFQTDMKTRMGRGRPPQ